MGPVGCFGQIENIKRQSLSSREQVAKKQALVTAEMLLETYTANLEAKYASLIQSE